MSAGPPSGPDKPVAEDKSGNKPGRPLSPEEFAREFDVSRETVARLQAYVDMLRAWNERINLVAPSTLDDPWRRHILDSAQLHPDVRRRPGPLADLGSGAGFPGLVLAILGHPAVTLVESDQRKCAFLREAARVAGVAVTVLNARIEQAAPIGAAVVTARACAPLATLLGYAARHLAPEGTCLLLKGQHIGDELTDATRCWGFEFTRRPSAADPEGWVLRLENLRRA